MILYAFYPVPSATSALPKICFNDKFPRGMLDRVRCHVEPEMPPPCLDPGLAPLSQPLVDDDFEEDDMGADEFVDSDDEEQGAAR